MSLTNERSTTSSLTERLTTPPNSNPAPQKTSGTVDAKKNSAPGENGRKLSQEAWCKQYVDQVNGTYQPPTLQTATPPTSQDNKKDAEYKKWINIINQGSTLDMTPIDQAVKRGEMTLAMRNRLERPIQERLAKDAEVSAALSLFR